MERNWRDAKIPQWVKDSIAEEIAQWELTAALSWPTEPKPEPLPFHWGGYDRLHGEAQSGTFWKAHWGGEQGSVTKVHIKRNEGEAEPKWQSWIFSSDGEKWSTSVVRGTLFPSEHEACLWLLWEACEAYAKKLTSLRRRML